MSQTVASSLFKEILVNSMLINFLNFPMHQLPWQIIALFNILLTYYYNCHHDNKIVEQAMVETMVGVPAAVVYITLKR